MHDQRVRRRRDAVQGGLGKDAEQHDQENDGHQHPSLSGTRVGDLGVGTLGTTVKDALVGPEQVHRRGETAQGREHAPPRVRGEGTDQDEVLRDEARETRQANAGEHRHGEECREHRGRTLDAGVVGDLDAGATSLEEANDEEEANGDDAVVEHQQHRASDPDGGTRHDPERDEAHLRERGVRDESLQVLSDARQDRTVQDADHRQGQDVGPHAHLG